MAALLRASTLRRVSRVLPALSRATVARHFSSHPSDRKYKESHEWAKVDGDIATIGITDHAQKALGDIVFAELPDLGSEAGAGEAAASVESVKATSDIYSPISGEVIAVNDKLEEAPELINSEPHEDGWIFRIKLSDPSQLDTMLSSEDYEKTLDE